MKTFLIALIVGILVGAGAFWFFSQQKPRTTTEAVIEKAKETAQTAAEKTKETASVAVEKTKETAKDVKETITAKLEKWHLRPEDIKEEMAKFGKIVRRQVRDISSGVTDAATDAKITAAVKAKYIADPDLAAWKIDVDTSDGHVTLSGTVSSYEHIGVAIVLAMETEGVRDVTSNLQVKPAKVEY